MRILLGVVIYFVGKDEISVLRDIDQYHSTQIDEMPMNLADLIDQCKATGVEVFFISVISFDSFQDFPP